MSKSSGKIYELVNDRWGVAIHKEQSPAFSNLKKVYLHIYKDRKCTIAELDHNTGKKHVTLKHISKIKAVGYID